LVRLTDEEKQQHREIIRRLSGKLGDDLRRIEQDYPLAKECPTCADRTTFMLDFESYECDCDYQRALQRAYFAANIGREFHNIGYEDFLGADADLLVTTAKSYSANFEINFHYGAGLTFTGPRGTGKTFAACCVLKDLIKLGHHVYFVSFADLVDAFAGAYKDDGLRTVLERRMKRAELLVIDEVRSDKRNTEGFLAHGLDSIIRFRTGNLLPTFVTTNMMTADEFHKEFPGAASLLAARNEVVSTKGTDQRQQQVQQRILGRKNRGEKQPIV
jgi:DNA replication protein DnaC